MQTGNVINLLSHLATMRAMNIRVNANHLAALFFALYLLSRFFFKPITTVKSKPLTQSAKYKGITWRSDRTVSVKTVAETSFARCDVHTVISEDGQTVFNDWIFLEEVNAVNIIVQTIEGDFVVFKQQKYAVPGETFSPVGGFVDDGEHPWTSAKREVLEELGLGSRATQERVMKSLSQRKDAFRLDSERLINVVKDIMKRYAVPPTVDKFGIPEGDLPFSDDPDWVYFGRYRTAVNRGGGFTYLYFLKNAVPVLPDGGSDSFAGVGDDEQQLILHLSVDEVAEYLSQARFQEIKWTAAFALSLLHINNSLSN